MATILKGAPVVAAMNERNAALCEQLKVKGITPTLAVVRVGEREDDLSYERGVMTRCGKVGVAVKQFVLPADATQEQLLRVLDEVNTDDSIHGCLLFRPLPKQFDDRTVRAALRPEKDIDGITDGSLAGVFTNTDLGYAPCTAQACMEILKYYNVPLSGKRAVVVGRSLVVGKPAAMMLDRENATVTLCNSRTRNLPEVCRQADIVVVAMGKMAAVGADCLRAGQTVVDVGIHVNEEGKLCGDVQFDAAEPVVDAITPVPGGVGAHGHDEGQGSRPDGKIGRSVCLQCRVCAQPPGQKPADAHAKGRCRQTHRQIEQHGLPQNAPGILLAVCAQILCHLNGKRHAQPGQHPVQQPCAGADDANGGCCGGTDMPHHGGVDVLHGGNHDLLQNGRDTQRQRHLCGVAQRHLLALPHPGRELLKCNGHGTSCVVGENYRLIHYYRELREKSQSKVNFAAGIDFWSRA